MMSVWTRAAAATMNATRRAVNFMCCGYGMDRYACEQVMEMFEDLNWLRCQRYEYRGAMYKALHKQFLEDWFKEWAAKKQSGE